MRRRSERSVDGGSVKTVGAVKHKLNQVRFRHLKRRLEAELQPSPLNCGHNQRLPEYASTQGQEAPPALCMFGADDRMTWEPSFCDERLDQGARARTCPHFCVRRTKDEIKTEFYLALDRMTLPEVAYHYPDMAALLWVLDAEDAVQSHEEPPSEEPPEQPPVTSLGVRVELPWYARWLGLR